MDRAREAGVMEAGPNKITANIVPTGYPRMSDRIIDLGVNTKLESFSTREISVL